MAIQSTTPATNKVVKTFEEMSEAAVDQSIAKSVETFATWKKTPYSERAALLHKIAGLLREKTKELSQMITLEMGKLVAALLGLFKGDNIGKMIVEI